MDFHKFFSTVKINVLVINKNGQALIQVIIASAIGVIVAFGTASMLVNQQLGINNVKFRSDADVFNEEIRALLSSPIACTNSFGGKLASVGASHDILNLFNSSASPGLAVYSTGQTYADRSVTINSMKLGNFLPGGAPGSAEMTLTNVLNTSKAASGPQSVARTINISLTLDGSDQIISCIALSKMSDGIWQRSQANLNNVFFTGPTAPAAGGFVGIGTSNPSAPLDIAGSGLISLMLNHIADGKVWSLANGFGVYDAKFHIISNAQVAPTPRFTIDTLGMVGISNPSPAYMLDVNGDINATGCLRAGNGTLGGTCASDELLKMDIEPFELGLDALLGINPKTFKYTGLGGHPASKNRELGVIARDVEETAPTLVVSAKIKLRQADREETEIKQVNYTAFTYILINAVKDIYHRWSKDTEEIHRELALLKSAVGVHAQSIQNLQQKNQQLQQDNAALKSYIGATNLHTPICN